MLIVLLAFAVLLALGMPVAFAVGVGGTVTIAPNQAEGTYTGTFMVLAQYN